MTKDEFETGYASRAGESVATLRESNIVLPCVCGDELCNGWAMVSRHPLVVRLHLENDAPEGTPWPPEIPKPITVWERKTAAGWEHNHIEDGHSPDVIPTPKCGQSWSGSWRRIHTYMRDGVVEPFDTWVATPPQAKEAE